MDSGPPLVASRTMNGAIVICRLKPLEVVRVATALVKAYAVARVSANSASRYLYNLGTHFQKGNRRRRSVGAIVATLRRSGHFKTPSVHGQGACRIGDVSILWSCHWALGTTRDGISDGKGRLYAYTEASKEACIKALWSRSAVQAARSCRRACTRANLGHELFKGWAPSSYDCISDGYLAMKRTVACRE